MLDRSILNLFFILADNLVSLVWTYHKAEFYLSNKLFMLNVCKIDGKAFCNNPFPFYNFSLITPHCEKNCCYLQTKVSLLRNEHAHSFREQIECCVTNYAKLKIVVLQDPLGRKYFPEHLEGYGFNDSFVLCVCRCT
jgi:hypothetical protein